MPDDLPILTIDDLPIGTRVRNQDLPPGHPSGKTGTMAGTVIAHDGPFVVVQADDGQVWDSEAPGDLTHEPRRWAVDVELEVDAFTQEEAWSKVSAIVVGATGYDVHIGEPTLCDEDDLLALPAPASSLLALHLGAIGAGTAAALREIAARTTRPEDLFGPMAPVDKDR